MTTKKLTKRPKPKEPTFVQAETPDVEPTPAPAKPEDYPDFKRTNTTISPEE